MGKGSPSIEVKDPSLLPFENCLSTNAIKPDIPSGFICIISAFSKDNVPTKDEVSELLKNLSLNFNITYENLPDKDWQESWKKSYTGIKIKNFIKIVPPWLKQKNSEIPQIVINPGEGFGTGTHPTTHLCMEEMKDIDFRGLNILDAGCGSGILGIIAKKFGAQNVLMVEKDENALLNAKENVNLNNLDGKIDFLSHDLTKSQIKNIDEYDIIFSNILLNINTQFISLNRNKFKNNAQIYLTGVLSIQNDQFSKFLQKSELLVVSKKKLDDWHLYHVK